MGPIREDFAGQRQLRFRVRGETLHLFKNKGENVVVSVEHSACGGCHMKLPTQIVTSCRAQAEIVTCPNCGRILYFTSDMSLTAAD